MNELAGRRWLTPIAVAVALVVGFVVGAFLQARTDVWDVGSLGEWVGGLGALGAIGAALWLANAAERREDSRIKSAARADASAVSIARRATKTADGKIVVNGVDRANLTLYNLSPTSIMNVTVSVKSQQDGRGRTWATQDTPGLAPTTNGEGLQIVMRYSEDVPADQQIPVVEWTDAQNIHWRRVMGMAPEQLLDRSK